MPKHLTLQPTALFIASLSVTGCSTPWLASNSDRPAPAVQPADFIGEPTPTEVVQPTNEAAAQADKPHHAAPANNRPTAHSQPQAARPIDAMVGHINGEAVYADQIFDINLIAQLESFGRRFDGNQFQTHAGNAIQDRLQGIIINKLILGEAELNLQEAQRRRIEARIQAEREEMLRFYGQGSLAKAKADFKKERGKELEAYLVDFREELIVGSYIRSKVTPKIVVNQRDVERYYDDNIQRYHQPTQRVIRLMIAVDADASAQIQTRLDKGEAFEQVAGDSNVNQYNPTHAGAYRAGDAIPGDKPTNQEPINAAILPLQSGEYAGPIVVGDKTFFVEVVKRTEGVKVELADAQIQIEQTLRSLQFEKHALRFRLDLLKRGSYSDPGQMGSKLLDIASARYDQ